MSVPSSFRAVRDPSLLLRQRVHHSRRYLINYGDRYCVETGPKLFLEVTTFGKIVYSALHIQTLFRRRDMSGFWNGDILKNLRNNAMHGCLSGNLGRKVHDGMAGFG